MTDVKSSLLYKTLKKAVRKEDHTELLRMLEMVPDRAFRGWEGLDSQRLVWAFWWEMSPQGLRYWDELSSRLSEAGHDCY